MTPMGQRKSPFWVFRSILVWAVWKLTQYLGALCFTGLSGRSQGLENRRGPWGPGTLTYLPKVLEGFSD